MSALTATQGIQGISGTVSSFGLQYANNTVTGSKLFALALVFSGSGTLSVTDSVVANTWTAISTLQNDGSGHYMQVWECANNQANGSTKNTITLSTTGGAQTLVLVIVEYTGTGTFDAISIVSANNTTTSFRMSFEGNQPDSQYIVLGWGSNVGSFTAGGGFTQRSNTGGGNALWVDGYFSGAAAYQTATGTLAGATWSAYIFTVATDATLNCMPPTFDPPYGRYATAVTVTLSTTLGNTIYYTTDGSTPTHASSSVASGGTVSISASKTLKAIAAQASYNDSAVSTAAYTIGTNASSNLWQSQGAMSLPGTGPFSNPSVIYDTNPVILTGLTNVFKMWTGVVNGGTGVYYYESADGLTNWNAHPSNPIVSGVGVAFPTVFKVRGTYYLYTGPGAGSISVRTATDGVTFGAATTAITQGPSGTWDAAQLYQVNLVPGTPGFGTGTGETYYAYYEGISGGGGSGEGLVTSTDLIHWTKDSNNPQFPVAACMCFEQVGGTYYVWAPTGGSYNNQLQGIGFNGLTRWSSPNPWGPWTKYASGGVSILTNYPTLAADLNSGNTTQGTLHVQDPSIAVANGNVYMYGTRTKTAGNQLGINATVAFNTTLAQLVAGPEGVYKFPTPGFNFFLNAAASDLFQRADGPLGSNWTPLGSSGSFGSSQIASHLVEPSGTTTNGDSFFNAVAFPSDQWSKVTVQTDNAAYVGADVRMNATGPNAYRCWWNAVGNLGTSGTLAIQKVITGTPNNLTTFTALTLSQNDTLMLVVAGANLLAYYNLYPMLAATDSSIASGSPGFMVNANGGLVTASQISAWAGGTENVIPPSGPTTSNLVSLGLIVVASAGTPVPVSAALLNCNQVYFSTVRGSQAGQQMYVGYAGMNKSTLAGVDHVLQKPTATAADSWVLLPLKGQALIDLSAVYIDADTSGDALLVSCLI